MKALAIAIAMLSLGLAAQAQTTHYLDCSAATSGDSQTTATAWNSLEQANAATLQPGDRLLLHRGSHCNGKLQPKGSGTAQAPILLGAYGQGALPVIDAGTLTAGVELNNQQFWEIENLEVFGGSLYGLHVGGNLPRLEHFHLRNLVVHHVTGEPQTKESGLIVVGPAGDVPAIIDDVLIDGVTAYDTTQWAGIIVTGASFDATHHRYGSHIAVRNSIVHDVAGDGILLASVRHGLIEHNVAWNTGMQETQTIGTPNGIWQWMCVDCSVSFNEGFFTDSPGVDGGVFDIDYGDIDNTVEHNFAHDSQGYCVSIFGAEGSGGDSVNSIVRENTCLHNARSPRLAQRQGAIFVDTWHGGKLNGLQIERNIVLWEPPLDAPAIHAKAEFFGDRANRIADNTILLQAGSPLQAVPTIQLQNNHVCRPSTRSAVVKSSGEKQPDSLCSCWTDWRAKLASNSEMEAGVKLASLPSPGNWRLVAMLASSPIDTGTRGQIVLTESMLYQFGRLGLRGVVLPRVPLTADEATALRADWHLSSLIDIASTPTPAAEIVAAHGAQLLLVKPDNSIAAKWLAPTDSAAVWLWLEDILGTPPGMQRTPVCSSK